MQVDMNPHPTPTECLLASCSDGRCCAWGRKCDKTSPNILCRKEPAQNIVLICQVQDLAGTGSQDSRRPASELLREHGCHPAAQTADFLHVHWAALTQLKILMSEMCLEKSECWKQTPILEGRQLSSQCLADQH